MRSGRAQADLVPSPLSCREQRRSGAPFRLLLLFLFLCAFLFVLIRAFTRRLQDDTLGDFALTAIDAMDTLFVMGEVSWALARQT